jgi:hypothetical protein
LVGATGGGDGRQGSSREREDEGAHGTVSVVRGR